MVMQWMESMRTKLGEDVEILETWTKKKYERAAKGSGKGYVTKKQIRIWSWIQIRIRQIFEKPRSRYGGETPHTKNIIIF
jgi:hypothetical protein